MSWEKLMSNLADISEGDGWNRPVLVLEAKLGTTSKGDPYVSGTLRDESSTMPFKIWRTDEAPETGVVINARGKVTSFRGTLQLTVEKWSLNSDVDPGKFVESAHRPAEPMLDEVLEKVREHCRSHLAAIVHRVVGTELLRVDDSYRIIDQARWDSLLECPAAKRMHHARYGGLVQHIHSMTYLALGSCRHYSRRYGDTFDAGMVLAGAVLHDIGKLQELSGAVGTQYTQTGTLQGHIGLGLEMLHQAVEALELSADSSMVRHLQHLIRSHHGKKEWGSPVEPRTPEAKLLHRIDMFDSRIDKVCSAVRKMPSGETRTTTAAGEELYVMGGGDDE